MPPHHVGLGAVTRSRLNASESCRGVLCFACCACFQDNYLNRDEMLAALQEVGVFNGIRAKQVGERVHGRAAARVRVGAIGPPWREPFKVLRARAASTARVRALCALQGGCWTTSSRRPTGTTTGASACRWVVGERVAPSNPGRACLHSPARQILSHIVTTCCAAPVMSGSFLSCCPRPQALAQP